MLLRTATAALGLAVLLGGLWGGLPWVFLLTCLAAVLGIREFYRLFPPGGSPPAAEVAAAGGEVPHAPHSADGQGCASESGWGQVAGGAPPALAGEADEALPTTTGDCPLPANRVVSPVPDESSAEAMPLTAGAASAPSPVAERQPPSQPPLQATGEGGEDSDTGLPVLVGIVWAVAFVIGGAGANGLLHFWAISLGVFAVGAFVSLLWLIAFYHGPRWPAAAAYLMGGPVYVGFLLGHVMVLAQVGENLFLAYPLEFDILPLPDDIYHLGRNWLLFALVSTFATDTGAYLVGRAVGRHPMAPSISPNKTWEGAAGGLLGAVLAAVLLERTLNLGLGIPGWDSAWNWQPLLIGATVGIVSQAGDLLESWLKRRSQVKDAGSLMPGHGGILDRLDSLLVTIPVVYYLLLAVARL